MAKNGAILYGFWQSSCSWRVRAALRFKNIPYEERGVDIVKTKQQGTEQYRAINPAQKVPALVIDNETLVESMAIVQYLEESRPQPSLMPGTLMERVQMRQICETIVSGIQPLQNIGIKRSFSTLEEYLKFSKYWTERGLLTLEELLRKSAGKCCVGDQITIADLCLVPQTYNAVSRFTPDLSKYPTVSKVYKALLNEKVFQETHPEYVKTKL
ncbi:probable maleylacetoacetate isomerase 1 isoform X2 [Trichoplusia ni]|uniref:maleylacetoacetate isomerase n=1 Tax=Trichoplusia ni TaxID=7111 RepID=A0A7E5VC25_TRINI|nr:probable maleylacetoacetate isomerase 1 isoform X2 [Trichoplusia ni]